MAAAIVESAGNPEMANDKNSIQLIKKGFLSVFFATSKIGPVTAGENPAFINDGRKRPTVKTAPKSARKAKGVMAVEILVSVSKLARNARHSSTAASPPPNFRTTPSKAVGPTSNMKSPSGTYIPQPLYLAYFTASPSPTTLKMSPKGLRLPFSLLCFC